MVYRFQQFGWRRGGGRAGFTLLELLVVMAIISVLIAFLLPSLSSARAMAHKAKCSANVRQIGLGIETYANENRGYHPTRYENDSSGFPDVISATLGLPPFSNTVSYTYTWGTYTGQAVRHVYFNGSGTVTYFRNLTTGAMRQSIFYCPGALLPSQSTDERWGSYASNIRLTGNRTLNFPFYGRRIQSGDVTNGVQKPSLTLSVVCSGGRVTASNLEIEVQTTAGWAGGAQTGWRALRRTDGAYMKHVGATNEGFLDGHVGTDVGNRLQPISWTSDSSGLVFYDPREFRLLDLSYIVNPTLGAPRLSVGDTVGP
jgi:prepilin-type N-terminal cleavage/methylation domain-containing protein